MFVNQVLLTFAVSLEEVSLQAVGKTCPAAHPGTSISISKRSSWKNLYQYEDIYSYM